MDRIVLYDRNPLRGSNVIARLPSVEVIGEDLLISAEGGSELKHRIVHFLNSFQAVTNSCIDRAEGNVRLLMIAHSRYAV
jgi:hypothetical protein